MLRVYFSGLEYGDWIEFLGYILSYRKYVIVRGYSFIDDSFSLTCACAAVLVDSEKLEWGWSWFKFMRDG